MAILATLGYTTLLVYVANFELIEKNTKYMGKKDKENTIYGGSRR